MHGFGDGVNKSAMFLDGHLLTLLVVLDFA
jgi:hypothetical protein